MSTVVQAAIQEYLTKRGYTVKPATGTFHITPATKGSGSHDASIQHDRYFAETVVRE
ncbi:MAG TPA: hypothetical protein VNL16_19080 [Chloroflexota bacterium]|nr:hypothetical protein [Chloroflexota bacterium]